MKSCQVREALAAAKHDLRQRADEVSMAVADDSNTLGRARLDFADERDIDEFVDVLGKFERGEISPKTGVDSGSCAAPTASVRTTSRCCGSRSRRASSPASQMRALAGVAARYSRGFCHVTTRQNIQFHFVLLEGRRRGDARARRRRVDHARGVRQLGAQHHRLSVRGTSETEIFDVTPYAEALTRYFLRHPLAACCRASSRSRSKGCARITRSRSINDIGWRARIVDGKRGFRVTVAGGTSILPVTGYVLYEFLPVEEMFNVAEAVVRVFHRFGDYEHSPAQPDEVHDQGARLGRLPRSVRGGARGVQADGGARLPFDPPTAGRRGRARLGAGEAPTLQAVAAARARR